jgi:replicative DNA helicase
MKSSTLVFTPIEVSNATEQYVDNLRKTDGDGMPLYINGLEYDPSRQKGFLPVKRGELITILGRPGNGKTGFMLRWARERARDLKLQASSKVVIYLTLEQLVEELRLFHVAAEESISATDMANGKMDADKWDLITKSLRGMHTTPLWFAGKSMKRRRDKTEINEQSLRAMLESVEKWQGDDIETEIDSVFVDYLQRFRSKGSDWTQFYGDLVNGLKDMAGDFATRFIVGVQAKREVDLRSPQIPLMEDGQWTSTIEQQSDGMISVTRPSHYVPDGGEFDDTIVRGHNQMIISVLKRKMGPEHFSKWVSFQPEYNRLDELEEKRFSPNEDRNEEV